MAPNELVDDTPAVSGRDVDAFSYSFGEGEKIEWVPLDPYEERRKLNERLKRIVVETPGCEATFRFESDFYIDNLGRKEAENLAVLYTTELLGDLCASPRLYKEVQRINLDGIVRKRDASSKYISGVGMEHVIDGENVERESSSEKKLDGL